MFFRIGVRKRTMIAVVAAVLAAAALWILFSGKVFRPGHTDGALLSAEEAAEQGTAYEVTNEETGEIAVGEDSDLVEYLAGPRTETALGTFFVASGEYLDSVSVYADKWEKGHKAIVQLYEVEDDGSTKMLADESVRLATEDTVHGSFLRATMNVAVNPGGQYILLVRQDDSKLRLGLSIPTAGDFRLASFTRTYAYGDASWQVDITDAVVDGYILRMQAEYTDPLGAGKTAACTVLILVLLAAVLAGDLLYFRKFPERDKVYSLGRALALILGPAVIGGALALGIMVFPMKVFDYRTGENLFYLLGIAVAAAAAVFSLHLSGSAEREKKIRIISFREALPALGESVPEVLEMAALAFAIHFGCEYLNGLYDLNHAVAERAMTFCLLLVFIISGRNIFRKKSVCILTLVGILASAEAWFFLKETSGKDMVLDNEALRNLLFCTAAAVPAFLIAVKDVITLVQRKKKGQGKLRLCLWYAVPAGLFLLAAVLFRNTRLWIVTLAAAACLFFLRYLAQGDRERVLRIALGGIVMQFAAAVIYCQTRRYFLAFIFYRFPMQFHTVTVTAEYLTMVEAAAMTLLLAKYLSAEGEKLSITRLFCYLWKELVLFGTASVYLLFTMSRTGILSTAVMCFILLAVVAFTSGKSIAAGLRKSVCAGLIMICAAAAAFPPVFALQRLLPAVVSDPVILEIELPDYADVLLRPGHRDSYNFMCLERFLPVFGSKVLGLPDKDYDYFNENIWDRENDEEILTGKLDLPSDNDLTVLFDETSLDRAVLLADSSDDPDLSALADSSEQENADEIDEELEMEAAGDNIVFSSDTPDSGAEGEGNGEDVTNGRTTIWKSYISELNLFGHDSMGCELPDGEIAVHAHNTILQVCYDHGIITGALFVLFLVLTFIRGTIYYSKSRKEAGWSNARDRVRKGYTMFPLAALTGFGVAGLAEWVFQYSHPATLILMIAVLPLLVEPSSEDEN